MSKVEKQPEPETGGVQVVQHLCPMLRGELRYSLQLHDDLVVAQKVRSVRLRQLVSVVSELQLALGNERYSLALKLDVQAFLVDRLQETAAHRVVDVKTRTHDGTALNFVEQL